MTKRWGLERTSLILTPERNIKFAGVVKRVAKLGIHFEYAIAHSNQSILRQLTGDVGGVVHLFLGDRSQ